MAQHSDCIERMVEGIKKNYPDYANITAPVELLSGKLYMIFYADKPFRGKKKRIEIPVLLSKCPFCGEKYEEDQKNNA